MIECGIADVIGAYDRVERTIVADMTELDVLDVIWRATDLACDCGHLVRRHVDEFGIWINEAADQPRASNAVDLGVLARDPLVLFTTTFAASRQLALVPSFKAS